MNNKNNKETKKTISLTKKQYLSLMKAVYLGNWMANACRAKDKIKDLDDIESHIFSYASRFGLQEFVDHDSDFMDTYYPTRAFEEDTDVHELHDYYDNHIFWQELASRLAQRDLNETYSKKEITQMSDYERFEKLMDLEEKIADRLYKNGLEFLRFLDDSKKG